MPAHYIELPHDHNGDPLPDGVTALAKPGAVDIVGYKARWWQVDELGKRRHPSKNFNAGKLGGLDRALRAATDQRNGAAAIIAEGHTVHSDSAGRMTLDEVFQAWLDDYAADHVTERHGEEAIYWWRRLIKPRIGSVRVRQVAQDLGILSRLATQLTRESIPRGSRRAALKHLRAVLTWFHKQHPNTLPSVQGLVPLPPERGKRRGAAATDLVTVERIIEQMARRPARYPLLVTRDVAFAAAMGYTVAARPSEWLRSATWADLYPRSVEFQRPFDDHEDEEPDEGGLKTGARPAWMLKAAKDRIDAYSAELERTFGPQPRDGLVFQLLDPKEGPLWDENTGAPLPWDKDTYDRWRARVWKPACKAAAQSDDTDDWIGERLRFYDLRHTAVSMALHAGYWDKLHELAAYAGHDVRTLQRIYSHFIARYRGRPPFDLEEEVERARVQVAENPFTPDERTSPQRAYVKRRRRDHALSLSGDAPR